MTRSGLRRGGALGRWLALSLALGTVGCTTTQQATSPPAARGCDGEPDRLASSPTEEGDPSRAAPGGDGVRSTLAAQPGAIKGLELIGALDDSSNSETFLLASDLLPPAPQSQRWRVADGPDEGAGVERMITTGGESGQVEDRWGSRRSYLLTLGSDGSLVMPSTISHEDAAVTTFDPPLVLAPPRLVAGAPFNSASEMRVVDGGALHRVRQEGRAERSIIVEGVQRVRTPLGDFTALRVRVQFSATLQLATARDVVILYVAPGVGVIAEEREERIRALGFVNRSRRTTMVREQ